MDHNIPLSPLLSNEHDESHEHSRVSSTSTVMERQTHAAAAAPQLPSTRLHRSSWALFLVAIYVTLTLYSWIATCKAIKAFSQNALASQYDPYSSFLSGLKATRRRYEAARVIQSFATVITIPLTSAICSNAAVIFAQRNSKSGTFTIRQLLTLADRSWSRPTQWPATFFDWKRYGSIFLLGTTLLNLLGAAVPPLQQALLTSKAVKIPVYLESRYDLFDLAGLEKGQSYDQDNNIVSLMTRNKLGEVDSSSVKPQDHLWEGRYPPCTSDNWSSKYCFITSNSFGNSFKNMSELHDPFFSELPNGFNTGILQQFAPRINSTAKYQNISTFPSGCSQLPGAFFAEYANTSDISGPGRVPWAIQVCMPADQRKSPWTRTRDRQDFSETLYVNITNRSPIFRDTPSSLYMITVETTAGYFELPNHLNGDVPGPLLLKDPLGKCGNNCPRQSYGSFKSRRDRRDVNLFPPDSSTALASVSDKGPLLTTIMALFGTGSFISARLLNPSAYSGVVANRGTSFDQFPISSPNSTICADLVPMSGLLDLNYRGRRCIRYADGGQDGSSISGYLSDWIGGFSARHETDYHVLANAFTAAAFIANQAWVESYSHYGKPRALTVAVNHGSDDIVPWMSKIAMIILSALLGLQLLALLLLALYSSIAPRWTDTLDGFAMMRIGAALAQKTFLPLAVGRETHKLDMLDKYPGRIGGSAEEVQEGILQLELGGPNPIDRDSIYTSYPGDSDLPQRLAVIRQREKTAEYKAMADERRRAFKAETVQQQV